MSLILGNGFFLYMAAASAAREREEEEYRDEFLKLGFELKQEWIPNKIDSYFVPAKFFIKKYLFNATEKRIDEAYKCGALRIITENETGPHEQTDVFLKSSDYLLCKTEKRNGYYIDGIYYILTGNRIDQAYYKMPLSDLRVFKEEEDKKFIESQKK